MNAPRAAVSATHDSPSADAPAAGTALPPVVDDTFVATHPEVFLADVRAYLDGRSGWDAYVAEHLPGAVFVDLETQLAAHDQPPSAGRHPFPSPEHFAAAMGALGIGDDTTVVAYDDAGGFFAARLVVMLRMLGRAAALLDGGLSAWTGTRQHGPGAQRAPRHFTPTPWPQDRLATLGDVRAALDRGAAVIDGRAAARFRGEVAVIDRRPGHIPGARSAPVTETLDGQQRLRPRDELRDHFAALGITAADGNADAGTEPAIAYCGSGVSACLNIVAIEHAGLRPPRLYVASWSGYSSDDDHPAALGDAP